MELLNFDTESDRSATRVVRTVAAVAESVTVRPRTSEARAHLIGGADTWESLRDYVVAQIEQRWGPFPRDPKKEYGIFSSFLSRWGGQAMPIARHAFEIEDGRWRGAPISVNRFCKASDQWFGQVIAERLTG